MSEGKFSGVSVSIFNGMDRGTAATKLANGYFVTDSNGRRDQIGTWGQRLGVVRWGGGVAQAASSNRINSIHQFLPISSGSQNYVSQWENGSVRLSSLVFVAGGVAEGFSSPTPQA